MRKAVYILTNEQVSYVTDRIVSNTYIDKQFYSQHLELNEEILVEMATLCKGDYFYVIKTDKEVSFPNFSFSFYPEKWDSEYVHIWNDTTVRLFNVSKVLEDPSKFTDAALEQGRIVLKVIPKTIYTYPVFDIVFLSYDEMYADKNYEKLATRFPRVRRIMGVDGIFEAHKAAALIVRSDMFYVVDADAEIVPMFNFNYQPYSFDRQSVHVWHSRNPINDLEYGYGGVKLFPTNLLLDYNGSPLDFTTSVSKSFKVIPEVSNVTKFNTDPFSTWRSAFRECAKLASKLIQNQDNTETEHRLSVWCSTGEDREFGDFAILGAKEGMAFGLAHKDQPELLGLINDFKWLEKKFNS